MTTSTSPTPTALFMDNLQGVVFRRSAKVFMSIGVKDNEVLIFSELMDAKSLFLTANADTVYFMGISI